MRFVADENFPGPAVRALRRRGDDVRSIAEECPGSSDARVIDIVAADLRILLTLDKDFGEIARQRLLPAKCGIVLFRLRTVGPDKATAEVLKALSSLEQLEGMFAVVKEGWVRIGPLPFVEG